MTARPNVLLIVSDDHGYGDRSRLGRCPDVSTPALDRLAAGGVDCTDGYVSAPICSPSRAGLIAGRYQQRWGARWFDSSRFAPDGASLAERFADLGYATGYFGKVHYGPEQPGDRACPPHHGFAESYYGLAGRQMGRLNYLHHSRAAVEAYGPEASWRMAVQPMFDGDDESELEGFLTAELGGRARDFIGRHADEPFFCMVAFNAVHNFCWQLPPDELARRGLPEFGDWDERTSAYADWYDGAISPNLPNGRAYYLAQLELMDAEIGRVLDDLDARGLADDTIVVYLTDNGGSTCNYGNNAPLAGTKYTVWEGGIRVPYTVRWPAGGVRGGRSVSGLVSSLDLYPTLLAAAGAPAEAYPDCDGIDQLPLLRGERDTGHDTLYWDCGWQWAIRRGDWKLRYCDGDAPAAAGIRTVEHADPGAGLGLYHLGDDIGETTNLAGTHPDLVAELAADHERWRASL